MLVYVPLCSLNATAAKYKELEAFEEMERKKKEAENDVLWAEVCDASREVAAAQAEFERVKQILDAGESVREERERAVEEKEAALEEASYVLWLSSDSCRWHFCASLCVFASFCFRSSRAARATARSDSSSCVWL